MNETIHELKTQMDIFSSCTEYNMICFFNTIFYKDLLSQLIELANELI